MSDAMQRLLEERWPRVRDEAIAQVDRLRSTASDDIEQVALGRTDARKVAHQLRGRFGMYGHRDASVVAGAIEDRLVAAMAAGETANLGALSDDLIALIDRLAEMLAPEGTLTSSE